MPFYGKDRRFDESKDPSNQAAQQTKHYIDIYHVQSQNSISFKAMLTDYSDSYETKYKIEEYSGQPDLNTYDSMERKVSFSIDIPAASEKEAVTNMRRCGELIRMLNTSKDGLDSVEIFKSFKIRFANFLIDSSKSVNGDPQAFGVADKTGVSCYIDSFNFNPDLEAGFFSSTSSLLPKLIKCSFNIRVQKPASYQKMVEIGKNKYFQGDKEAIYYPFGLDGMERSRPDPSSAKPPAGNAKIDNALNGDPSSDS